MLNEDLYDFFDSDSSDIGVQNWSGPLADPARVAYRERLCCWILRIYTGVDGMPSYSEIGHLRHSATAQLLGVPELAQTQASADEVRLALQRAAAQLFAKLDQDCLTLPVAPCSMRSNIEWLATSVNLNPVESELFELACALWVFKPLRVAQEIWGDLMPSDVIHALSVLTQRPRSEVELALRPKGRLMSCGLLLAVPQSEDRLHRMVRCSRRLVQRLTLHQDDPAQILSNLVLPLQTPQLAPAQFAHIHADTELARRWLLGALAASSRGEPAGHLLVSGAPGLGKTEWVRTLLAQETTQAMELVVLDEAGHALSGTERLNHLHLSMRMLERSPGGVILFDEADDVFRGNGSGADHDNGSGASGGDDTAVSMANHRASLNRLIEDSRIPVVWIMNHPEVLDPAVLRRFDTVISFDAVPASVRMAMLNQRFTVLDPDHTLISPAELQRWAQVETLTPALIDRLAVVFARAQGAGLAMGVLDCRRWLCQRLPGKATRHLRKAGVNHAFEQTWRAEWVNASENLSTLSQGIARAGSARVLLYGPPGTGKTAYAHALARQLDRPLLEFRASDLLSAYVGETEQRISEAFDTAMNDKAVLFLDEVDSLLAHREHAVRNWEVSQVNELLEQIEDYDGVVVLATNRFEALDPAVLRRMDAKIRFEVMTAAQVQLAFEHLCESVNVQVTADELRDVGAVAGLTPGDFACVARKLRFAPLEGSETDQTEVGCQGERSDLVRAGVSVAQVLVAMLSEEVRFKGQGRRAIGF